MGKVCIGRIHRYIASQQDVDLVQLNQTPHIQMVGLCMDMSLFVPDYDGWHLLCDDLV